MEETLAQKYDRIQQFATRDWLGPSSASLSRLERVKANVHNITPTTSRNLRPSSASHAHKIYTELDTAPPLSTKSLHTTASTWRNNASVPELIKQQGERQSQRQASTQGPRRPWSGRKVPPSPSHPAQRRHSSSEADAVETENDSQRRLNAFISVKGAKYDPKSRPPSGKGSKQTTGIALAEMMLGLEDLSKQEVESTLEEFIRSQPSPGRHELARLSAAYGDHPSLIAPPPAPRGSPNPEEQTLFEEEEDEAMGRREDRGQGIETEMENGGSPYKEITVKQPAVPQLLRRPTPEPVRLSMTIPGVGDDMSEPEEDLDYFIDSARSDEASPDGKQPGDLELQSVTSEITTLLEDTPTSPPVRDQPTPLTDDTQVKIVSQNSPGTKDEQGRETLERINAADVGLEGESQVKARSRHSVHIVEERNVTIDITPRDILKPYVPRPPIGKRRPQSAVTVGAGGSRNSSEVSANSSSGSRGLNSASVIRGAVRPRSARPRLARVPIVGVDYGIGSEHSTKEEAPSQSDGTAPSRTRSEVETMMSRMGLSDEENDEVVRPPSASSGFKQVSQSSAKKNYYELSRESSTNASQGTLLTTKTIQLGDGGLQELKSVSVIKQASEPFRSALLRQDKRKDLPDGRKGRTGSLSDEDAAHQTHSAIRRPMKASNTVGSTAPPRPESRMGHRHGDTDLSSTQGETEEAEMKEANTNIQHPLTSTRPVSAPSKRRNVESASGRKSPGRIGRRPHSAKTPTNTEVQESKLKSRSSTAISTSPKKRNVDYKRNREAVRALREGTLNREKKYTKQVVAVEEPRTIFWRPRKQESESSEEEPKDVPLSAQEQEIEDMHQKLLERGVNVSSRTLARGLLPPTQRGYDDCVSELPEKTSLGLLNQPEMWLGKLFRKYKLAEKALIIANERMEIQAEKEAKLAARGPPKKKKKAVKKKVKRKKSSTAT